jgi:hypothetical protein
MTTVVNFVVVVVVVVVVAPFPTRATRLKDPAGESDPPVLRDGWMDGWISTYHTLGMGRRLRYRDDSEGREMSDTT